MDVIRILLAIVLPPVGVFLQVGIGLHFWLNILLTILGYIPGIIHAVWVIVKKWRTDKSRRQSAAAFSSERPSVDALLLCLVAPFLAFLHHFGI